MELTIAVELGRILIGLFYLYMVFNDFYYEKEFLAKMPIKIPFSRLVYRMGLTLMFFASLAVIFNFALVLGAAYLVVFVVVVTLIYHPLWGVQGETLTGNRITWFANLAQIGGLLVLIGFAGI